MRDSNRSFSGGSSNTSGSGKGRSGATGEGENKPLLNVKPSNSASSENAPVAEPLTPFEMTQMVQKFGSIVWSMQSIADDLYKSLSNPSVKEHQKEKISNIINDLRPITKRIFNCGLKLGDAFMPAKVKKSKF